MCPHEFDVAHCVITVKNVVFSFSLVAHPCSERRRSLAFLAFRREQSRVENAFINNITFVINNNWSCIVHTVDVRAHSKRFEN